MRELILGGQKSGKSRCAEERARLWLSQSAQHSAVLIATALPHDEEMRQRIERHQADRRTRLQALRCVEQHADLAAELRAQSHPQTLVIVDCLTLWLTQLMLPAAPVESKQNRPLALADIEQLATQSIASLGQSLAQAKGPVVLVSNEIGLGVIPLGREVRQFVDCLGRLNQAVAQSCDRVTFMAAGCALTLKEPT
jgi:adenosylcobinamide kinase / adenosylcobinamide-phosphate guanylyltransferase